jgi:hypothetical protein
VRRLLGPLISHACRQDGAPAGPCRRHQHPLSMPGSRNAVLPAVLRQALLSYLLGAVILATIINLVAGLLG